VLVGKLGQAALELLFPSRCLGCEAGGTFLCDACIEGLPKADGSRCSRCWSPEPGADVCSECYAAPPPFDGLRSAFVYRGVARSVVRGLKYRGMTALAPSMASLLAETALEYDLDADIVVPVPLSGLRHRTRGYNQASELAKYLARELDMPMRPRALERPRHTPPQARTADAMERRRNGGKPDSPRRRCDHDRCDACILC
jgi:predicted amidophosphoribosyltransferase